MGLHPTTEATASAPARAVLRIAENIVTPSIVPHPSAQSAVAQARHGDAEVTARCPRVVSPTIGCGREALLPQRPARRRHWLQRFFTMPGEGSQGWTLIARASTSSSAAGRRLDREVWLALAHHRIPKMDAEALAERTIIRNVTRHSRLMAG
jgi:hypothetical protein